MENVENRNIGIFLGEKNYSKYAKAFSLYEANGFKLFFNKEVLFIVSRAVFVALVIVAILANSIYKSGAFSKIDTGANASIALSIISLVLIGAISPSIYLFYRKVFKRGFIMLLAEKILFLICGFLLQEIMLYLFPTSKTKPSDIIFYNSTIEIISYLIVSIILLMIGSFVYTYFVYEKYKSIQDNSSQDFANEGKKSKFLAFIGTFINIVIMVIFTSVLGYVMMKL